MDTTLLRKSVVLFLYSLLWCSFSFAAKLDDEEGFIKKHLLQSGYDIARDAPAIVLYEHAQVAVVRYNGRGLVIREEVRKIVKLLQPDHAREMADILLQVRHNKDYASKISQVQGYTYNLSGGRVIRQEMDDAKTSISTDMMTVKFSLPAVHEGSVVDYRYTVERDFTLLFCSWLFQETYPKLYSEVEVITPKQLSIVSINENRIPFQEFDDRKKQPEDSTLPVSYHGSGATYYYGDECHKEQWVRRNIPAVAEEPFTDNYNNYTEKIQLQLTGVEAFMMNRKFMGNWEAFNKWFYESDRFYKQLGKTKTKTKSLVEKLGISGMPDADRSRKIFAFVRDSIRSQPSNNILVQDQLSDVLRSRNGNASEVNLLLVGMLQEAGLHAEPVLLSTRGHLKVLPQFPLPDRFNHVVCRLQLADTALYLDASGKNHSFGVLPAGCYNGYARIISEKGGSVDLDPASITDKQFTMITSEPEAGRTVLHVKTYFGWYEALTLREAWHPDTLEIKKHINDLLNSFSGNAKLLEYRCSGLSNPDTGLVLEYSVAFHYPEDADTVYFSPHFVHFFRENPFKSRHRMFPVVMDYARVYSYLLQLKLPEGMEVAFTEAPVNIKLSDEDAYKCQAVYDSIGNVLQISSRLQMRTARFEVEEYELLQSFIDKILEVQSAVCVLGKKHD